MGLFDGMFPTGAGWLGQLGGDDAQAARDAAYENMRGTGRRMQNPNDRSSWIADALGGVPWRDLMTFQGPEAQQQQPGAAIANPAYARLLDAFGPTAANAQPSPPAAMGGPAPQSPPPINVQPSPQPPAMPPMGGAPQPPMNISPQAVNGMPSNMAPPNPPQMPPQAQNAMAQQPPEPSLGDRLIAGANNFSNPQAGLIARLTGAAQGFSTGQQTAGSKLQETGTDPFTGQKTFAWVNPNNQTMKPATMSGQVATGQPGMGQFADAIRAGVGGQKLMDTAPPEIKNRLQAMLDGREAPPTGAALRNPQTQALINAAHAIDPAFDETKWGVRFAQRKNYEAGGKQFQEAQALNTVSGHLVNLMKSADALDNTPFPIVNGVMNWLRQNAGDPRIDKLNTDVHAVTSELSKAYKAGHVSDSDVRAWNQNINSAKSPEQFKSVIGELNDLLRSKRETLDEGYRSAMGPTPLPDEYSSQSKRSKGNFDSVSDWSLGGPKPAAPAQITATGPGGKKIVLQNGQWVPLK